MKLVKFNVSTAFHNIPDERYIKECELMEKLEDEDWEKFAHKLSSARNKFPYISVKMEQEIAVPNWYYNYHKDDICHISISFDKYRDRQGNRIPFKKDEAIRHGDMLPNELCSKSVKRFELVKDLDSKK